MDRRDLTELEDLPFTGSSGFWTDKMTGADIFDCGDMKRVSREYLSPLTKNTE